MSLDLSSVTNIETDKDKFCVEMMKRLDLQRKNEQFCDVILEVGSGDDQARLKAHKVVLCAASPFFDNALNSDMKEKKEGVIRLEETSKAVMEEVLEYLYTGHVEIHEDNAFSLLEIADFLIVPSLKKLTCDFVSRQLSPSNCIHAYYTAVRYQSPELEEEAKNFIFENFMDVTESADFQNLSLTEVEEWISSDYITVNGEEDVFQVIVTWLEHDESRKEESFFMLFRHVRLLYMSRNDIFNLILPHPLVKDSTACTELAQDVMKELSYGTEECYFAQPPRRCLNEHEDVIVACGLKETLCYLPSENEWYKLADMTKLQPPPHRNLFIQSSMSACHGKLYISCIDDDDGDVVTQRYDPLVNSWAPLLPFTHEIPSNFPVVANFQGFLYAFGGRLVRKYNPETNLWHDVPPLSVPRGGVCAVADQKSLYVIGGYAEDAISDVVEVFDPRLNSWNRIAPTPCKRMFACGAVVKSRLFIFGGFARQESDSKLMEVYDPAISTWSSIIWRSAPKYIYSCVSFKGKIFVLGMKRGISKTSSLRVYDVDKNEWGSCSSVPDGIQVFTIAPLRMPCKVLKPSQE